MKRLLFLFISIALLSCNKQVKEPDFVKDFQANISKQYNGQVIKLESTDLIHKSELEQRSCCFIVGRMQNHYPGLFIEFAHEGSPNKKFFILLYYNPTGPYYSSYNAWFNFSGNADPCNGATGGSISLALAPSGYYRGYFWVGDANDNFNICSSFIYDFHLIN